MHIYRRSKRWAMLALGLLVVVLLAACSSSATQTQPVVTVYKSPTCGCCGNWVQHMRSNGFKVEVHDVEDIMSVKRQHGVPGELSSCHTAIVDGYVVEGHVPAAEVQRLLQERPQVAGIAVPGMPVGAPGMDVPGATPQPYKVIAFDRNGHTSVFASYGQ